MAALSGEPWRGLGVVRLVEALGTRGFSVSIDDVDPAATNGDQSSWQGVPGSTVTLRYEHGTTGTVASNAPDQVLICVHLPGGAQVGDTWTINNPTTTPQTRTFHFDDNPLNTTAGSGRAGMLELYIQAASSTGGLTGRYGVTSRGTTFGDGVPALTTHDWARGKARSNQRIASDSISDQSLGGAEPAEFWYPDPIFVRITQAGQWYESIQHTCEIGTAPIRSKSNTSTAATQDFSFSNTSGEKVDADFPSGSSTQRLRLAIPSVTFGGDDRYQFANTGQPAGWTPAGQVITNDNRVPVNPDVSVALFTLDNGVVVYNRGEVVSGTLRVQNAGGEVFTPQGTDRLRTRGSGGSVEGTVGTVNRAAGTITWSHTFASSGNTAPADDVGDEKDLIWDDVQSGVNSPTIDTSPIGSLSSLYDLALHMQERQVALDPTLNTTQRLQANIGYYGFKVTNQRGSAVNGAVGRISLRPDDDSLSEVQSVELTTANINGHDGYTSLQSWVDPLPGGGWDIWASQDFVKDGNTGTKARPGTDIFDVTLIAVDPNLAVVVILGSDNPDGHFTAGDTLEIDASLARQTTNIMVESLSATVLCRRTNSSREWQFYDDSGVWSDDFPTPNTPVSATPIDMAANADDFGYQLDIATDATWGNNFEVIVLVSASGVTYRGTAFVDLVGTANDHAGYQFDGPGFVGFPTR